MVVQPLSVENYYSNLGMLKIILPLISPVQFIIHSQPGGGGWAESTPLHNFAFIDPNCTKFGVVIVAHKKNIN